MTLNNFNLKKERVNIVWAKLLADIKDPNLNSALNTLLTSYEKGMIVNRLIALSLIKKGKSYKEIGRELWLSPTTIRSLKRILESKSSTGYQTYRFLKNKRTEMNKTKIKILKNHPFTDWIEHYVSVFPKRHGSRWKFLKPSNY